MDAKEMLSQGGYRLTEEDTERVLQERPPVDDELIGHVSKSSFRVGDIVQLKSGGPQMTVTCPGPHYVACTYFRTDGTLFDNNFPPFALKLVEEPPASSS